jgi:hypothetical protein
MTKVGSYKVGMEIQKKRGAGDYEEPFKVTQIYAGAIGSGVTAVHEGQIERITPASRAIRTNEDGTTETISLSYLNPKEWYMKVDDEEKDANS